MTDRAAIYLRVSSVAQAGEDRASLPIQLRDCTAYCEGMGWEIVATEQDHESGKNVTRRGYIAILEMARAGLIDHVVVWAPERFGRRASEILSRYEELKDLKVDVVSVTRPIGDWLSMAIQAVIGENELRVMVSRMAPAKRYKAAQGFYVGRAPFGTVNVKGLLEQGPRFDLVQQTFDLCVAGVAVREICRRLNAQLDPETINHSTVRKILTNRTYIGFNTWAGLESPGKWPPLIDADLFERAGAALRRRYVERAPVSPAYPFWLLGLAFCGLCGSRMVAKVSVKTWGTKYAYLVCAKRDRSGLQVGCGQRHVLIEDAQDWLVAQLSRLWVDTAAPLARIASFEQAARDEREHRRAGLLVERERLESRIARAEAGYLDDLWGKERVVQIRDAVKDQMSAIETSLRELAAVPDGDSAMDVTLLQNGAWLDLRHNDPVAFREGLRRFVARVEVMAPGVYRVEWKGMFSGVDAR